MKSCTNSNDAFLEILHYSKAGVLLSTFAQYQKYHLGEFLIYEGKIELQMNSKNKIPATLVPICFQYYRNSFEYVAFVP